MGRAARGPARRSAVWLVTVGVVGYLVRRLDGARRLLFAAAGLAPLMPGGAFSWALWTDLGGRALAAE